jgi:hypothetical protein
MRRNLIVLPFILVLFAVTAVAQPVPPATPTEPAAAATAPVAAASEAAAPVDAAPAAVAPEEPQATPLSKHGFRPGHGPMRANPKRMADKAAFCGDDASACPCSAGKCDKRKGMGEGHGQRRPHGNQTREHGQEGRRGDIEATGLVQLQAALMTGKDNQMARGDAAQREGFGLRRARFGLEGDIGRGMEAGIEAELADAESLLNEAWLSIRTWKGSKVIAGAQKMPFSRSAMMSAAHTALAQRPFAVEAMAPFRQLGVVMTGKYPDLFGIEWHLGVFNAFERAGTFHAGIAENAGLRGNTLAGDSPFSGLSYVGRLSVEPLGGVGKSVADIGCPDRGPRLAVGGGAVYSDGGTNTTMAMSADLLLKWNGAHVMVEYLRDTAKPVEEPTTPALIPAQLDRQSIVAEAGYAFWRANAAVRFELIDPNVDQDDATDEAMVSGALGYQLMRNKLRLQLQYDRRIELQGSDLDNDTAYAQLQWLL